MSYDLLTICYNFHLVSHISMEKVVNFDLKPQHEIKDSFYIQSVSKYYTIYEIIAVYTELVQCLHYHLFKKPPLHLHFQLPPFISIPSEIHDIFFYNWSNIYMWVGKILYAYILMNVMVKY